MTKMEKTFQVIQGLQYDIEVIKMNASQYANRKEVEQLDIKFGSYCLQSKFQELIKRCDEFALNFDLQRTKDDVKKLDRTLDKFALMQNVKDLVLTT